MLESLEPSILLTFVEEAQSYIPTVRQDIIAFQQEQSNVEAVQQAYRQIHTIHGAALMIGLAELSDLAGSVENALEKYQEGEVALDYTEAGAMLEQVDQIEVLLAHSADELRAAVAEGGGASGEAGFETDDEYLDEENWGDETEAQTAAPKQPESFEFLEEEEEIDPEMLEVFALEAEEHLQIISANLQLLEQNPHNREALQTIRRSSHTLKGAAGVVGFKTTSKLAHRMEDLLDRLAEQPLSSTPQTTALLMASTDVLEALARGTSRDNLRSEIINLYYRFDNVLADGETVEVSDSLSAFAAQQKTVEALEESIKTAASTEPAETFIEVGEQRTEGAGFGAAQRMIVRVGLDRLDEISKLMGEMVISRTVIEQRLKDIEVQLEEMRLSTGRLRRIAGKLEVDYEASALAGGRAGAGRGVFAPMFMSAGQQSFTLPSSVEDAAANGDSNKYGFDDLEFDRYTEFHQLTRELVETSTDTSSITGELDDLLGDLEVLLTRQRRLSDELQDKMMRVRMVPLSTLAARLHRTVRVTADGESKLADLEIDGEDVEIDSQVLNSLAEPLLHLLRNSVVHGIEPPAERLERNKSERGLIQLKAFHEGTHIVLTITDDGRGIDSKRLRETALRNGFITKAEADEMSDEQALSLIFMSGLSTAKQINEVAGRGVGMDIVRDSVMRQQGTITLKSGVGRGTTMTIRLPMSLAVTRSLIVRAYGQRFALPINMVLQLSQVSIEDFDQLTQEKILWVGGKFYPVFSLNELLEMPPLAERDESRIPALLVQAGDSIVALTLDEVVEAREIVIKPLVNPLFDLRGMFGATILGDGSVVPILDLLALINRQTSKQAEARKAIIEQLRSAQPKQRKTQLAVMVVDDSPSVRRVMTSFITKAGFTAIAAKDGLEAVEILQLARELPDVILSDVEMPRMDGYELLATLKRNEAFSRIPIVMITSRAGDKHRQRALELGASDYVTKPYQDSVLLDTIKYLANQSN
jgi:chemosensory pili system protein ChpA (sensor histidine kinase/response regulator)